MITIGKTKIDKDSIATRVGFIIGVIIISVLILAIINIALFMSNRIRITEVNNIGIPTAVLSVHMIDEIDDINSNVLEFILGEVEEEEEFEENKKEFLDFLNRVDESNNFKESNIAIIEDLFNRYTLALRSGVFDLYRPEDEQWAKDRVNALTNYTAVKLEEILDELSSNKISNAGISSKISDIRQVDLPSVRYYLSLVDKAGDLIRDLKEYVEGDPTGKERFFSDTQTFEESFELLKPLEESEVEKNKLLEINAYYKVIRDGGLEVFSGYNPSNKLQAINNIETLEHQLLNELERMLDDLGQRASDKAFISLAGLRRQNNITIIILLILLSVVLLFSLFLMIYFLNRVSKPVNKISNAMRELAEGDTNVKLDLFKQKGEIKILGDSFEIFRENIKERENVEKALNLEKERAETANRSKSDFLSNMSHEIRTPMNSVLGFSELLKGIVKDPQGRSYLDSITNSGKTLLKLINDILDLSKIEAGKFSIQESKVDFRSFIEEIRSVFLTQVKAKGLEFNLSISTNFPDYIIIDEIRFRQVMVNLIGNAVKFTKNGFISITAESISSDNSLDHELVISIEDSGVGIPKEAQKRVFEAFVQKEGQLYSQFGGTGLGLAISQRIIKMMKGFIELESEEGKGSKFIIHIPEVKVHHTERAEKEESSFEDKEFLGSSVLVADDVASNKALIEGLLENSNLKLRYASNGQEVIDICKIDPPDLILLDMRMPKVDGYTAAKILNEDAKLKKIPKIAVTASAMVQDRKTILEVCDGFISKPIDREELFNTLYKFLPTNVKSKKGLNNDDFEGVEITILNNWKDEVESLLVTKDIDSMIDFADQIMEYSSKLISDGLAKWSEKLKHFCEELDIHGIKIHLSVFLNIINKVL